MRLVFRDKALDDIAHIHNWISQHRPSAAARVTMRLFTSIERLAIFPRLGRPGLDPGTLEWVVPRLPYLVVYEIRGSSNELHVLGVFHQAQHRSADQS